MAIATQISNKSLARKAYYLIVVILISLTVIPQNAFTDTTMELDSSKMFAPAVKPQPVQATLKNGAAASYKQITNDVAHDEWPRIDNGQVVWWKTISGNTRSIMLYDTDGTRQIATATNPNTGSLEIDNGWIYWQEGNWKSIYNIEEDRLEQLLVDGFAPFPVPYCKDGQVVWEFGGLKYFDGTDTVLLAAEGNYNSYYSNGGYVVWEQGNGGVSGRDYDIMLYDGVSTINLSEIGIANNFSGFSLLASPMGYGFGWTWFSNVIHEGQVVWQGYDDMDGDWEILHYDGLLVHQLTDNAICDYFPEIWEGQVTWQRGPNEVWFNNGIDDILITAASAPTEVVEFSRNKVVSQDPFNTKLWVFDPDTLSLTLLQDTEPNCTGMWPPGLQWDEFGVFWTIMKEDGEGLPYYVHKLFNNGGIQILAEIHAPPIYPTPQYDAGYAAWCDGRENVIQCEKCVFDDCEIVSETIWDEEIFFYSPQSGVQKLTPDNVKNCCDSPNDLDDAKVVWDGPTLPGPYDDCTACPNFDHIDILMGGIGVDDLSVYSQDVILDKVVHNGGTATVKATVNNEGVSACTNVLVEFYVDEDLIQQKSIPNLPASTNSEVEFEWNVSWDMFDSRYMAPRLIVEVDPNNDINEVNESNNTAIRSLPEFEKGIKKDNTDGKGFVCPSIMLSYMVPIAVWFDDDAHQTDDGLPTRYYNPVATTGDVLDDIDNDFNGSQYPNGRDEFLGHEFFIAGFKDKIKEYWQTSSGLVINQVSNQCELAGAPIASYLNWPMLPAGMIAAPNDDEVKDLIVELQTSYVLVISDDVARATNTVNLLNNLPLPKSKSLLVETYQIQPVEDNGGAEAFNDVLEAFGESPTGIIVTNSNSDSWQVAGPLAAFYKSVILDVNSVILSPVSYAPDSYVPLLANNALISLISDNPGNTHDIAGYMNEYIASGTVPLYLVGDVEWLPFAVEQDPVNEGSPADDDDKDWTATDNPYYDRPSIYPGGRMPLIGDDNIDYVARALQYDELPFGGRDTGDDWEDNILGAGIYNNSGRRSWPQGNDIWWVDAIVYQLHQLEADKPGIEVKRFFEDVSSHDGGWGKNWYRFDNNWTEPIEEAPLYWHIQNPQANPNGNPGNRNDGINNDHDLIGWESTPGELPIERVRDVNFNGVYDPGTDAVINEGLIPNIQAHAFSGTHMYAMDEEVWDGADNDGDGLEDEDCSYYRLMEVEEVYNEKLPGAPDITDIGPQRFIDLIDTNLIPELGEQGLIMYSGHAWTDNWEMRNMGGTPKTSDNRTEDQVMLTHNEIPSMSPALVIACACGSSRAWEDNCIGQQFLRQGALAYIGATGSAYDSSDELRQQMFNEIADSKLNIGKNFGKAKKNLSTMDLWAFRAGDSNAIVDKTRNEFVLFGLGSTEIDPGGGVNRITYGAPVYDDGSQMWSTDITCDIPDPIEIDDGQGGILSVTMAQDLLPYLADSGDYPALYSIPFDYHLPYGGSPVGIALLEATPYLNYDISMPKITHLPRWHHPDKSNFGNEPDLYDGPLYPDALFVSDSEYNPHTNSHQVSGAVAAYQVDGTSPQTTVYDTITLRLTYTAPIGIDETHDLNGNDLVVEATISSTDGQTHIITPSLRIETVGGVLNEEVIGTQVMVGAVPQDVQFQVNDITLSRCVGKVIATEDCKKVAQVKFDFGVPEIIVNEVYPNPQTANEEWIELYNGGELDFDLTGWNISDNDGDLDYTIPANGPDWDGVLEAGEYLVVHVGGVLDTAGEDLYIGSPIGALGTGGDSITVVDKSSAWIDFMRYGDCLGSLPEGIGWENPNPGSPSQGQSLGRDKDSTDTNHGSDWENKCGIDSGYPTPGGCNMGLLAEFSADRTVAQVGDMINFNNLTSGGVPPYMYEWDFNNDSTTDSVLAKPAWKPVEAGTYTVTLKVTDTESNLDSKTKAEYLTVIGGSVCLTYDDDLSGKIEFNEMVNSLMDYLTSQLNYPQMVEVLMCYLTG